MEKNKKTRKPWKVITQDNGEIQIFGNHHWIELEMGIPDWIDKEELENLSEEEKWQKEEKYFNYKNRKYFLSEIMNIHNKVYFPNPPKWMEEFDGYCNDCYFSGILIKLDNSGDAVKVYEYIG